MAVALADEEGYFPCGVALPRRRQKKPLDVTDRNELP
jgi:hypothetical protein